MKVFQYTSARPVAQVVQRVQEECKARGFGTLHTYPVQDILKSKGLEFQREYHILSVCNPQQAKRALETEPVVGVLLPCRVTVYEGADQKSHVDLPSPVEMFRWLGLNRPEFHQMALEVEKVLQKAVGAAVA